MRLENNFSVRATREQAWELLNDVPRVIPCMPGAELVEVVDVNTFKAMMHVKLGPISLKFATDVTRAAIDESQQRVRLSVTARELKGRGGAKATIESTLAEADSRTQVAIVTDLALQGTVAQYGSSAVEEVASELTARFAQALATELTRAAEPASTPDARDAQRAATQIHAVKPVDGLRLGLAVLWRSISRLVRWP